MTAEPANTDADPDAVADAVADADADAPEQLTPLGRLVAECVRRLDDEGPAVVDTLCREHPELAGELRERLDQLDQAGLLGRGRFGPHLLLRPLGRGGMGVVHLARDLRSGALVALKALPGRLVQSPAALQRFEREAQAVAALRHPGIVPLVEAGETDGIPWFTMEWIDGRTLADLVDSLRAMEVAAERLDSSHIEAAGAASRPDGRGRAWVETVCRLVLDVAEALSHAHEHGVIHRDVKPSNILIDGAGRARLFDFGLARVEDAASITVTGDFAGTPGYVAPEQLAGHGDGVGAQADVYALGVTLYELLTLRRPFEGGAPAEVLARVEREEPVPPRRHNPAVGRDVETICLTALEKQPAHRYASAAAMAADLRAALELRPIAARGPRWPRRLRRWIAQHAAAAAALGLLLLLIVGAPTGLVVANARIREQAGRALGQQRLAEAARSEADRQRERAQAEAARARRALDFLRSMLAAPAPQHAGSDVRVRDVLDRAAHAAPRDLAEDPRALADTHATLGLSYYHLGAFEESEAQLRMAVELARARGDGDLDDVRAAALGGLVAVLTDTGRLDAAAAAGTEALALQRRLHGERSRLAAEVLQSLGIVAARSGESELAVERFREALAIQREVLGPDSLESVPVLQNLAVALPRGPDTAGEREALLRRAVELQRRAAEGEGAQRLATALRHLAIVLSETGRIAEAVETQRECLAMTLEACGDDHLDVAMARAVLAILLSRTGPDEEAETLLRDALPTLRRLAPATDDQLATTLAALGNLLVAGGRTAGAEPVFREALEVQRRRVGPLSPVACTAAGRLASVLAELGRTDEAVALLQELRALAQAAGEAGAAVRASCDEALAALGADPR